jgi:hypothetical protein
LLIVPSVSLENFDLQNAVIWFWKPCRPVVARMQAFHSKLYDERIAGGNARSTAQTAIEEARGLWRLPGLSAELFSGQERGIRNRNRSSGISVCW